MAVLPRLSDLELFLLTVPNDEEDSPWMVMADLQVRDVDLLKPILLLYAQQHQLPWYIASYLKITMPRPIGESTLEAAPDLLVAKAEDWLRTSWSVPAEGKAPEFVLEVASGKSWQRDSGEKPPIYDGMGVLEYAVFAPERKDGPKLFGWRRAVMGQFSEWQVDESGVLWSQALGGLGLFVERGLWLRALDAAGRRLPTPGEVAVAERRRADAAAIRAEEAAARAAAAERRTVEEAAARAAAERRTAQEAAARAEAEAEAALLREEVRRLRGEQT
ncbi:MAG: Uma2 family endonuclease [Chloroflexota bacterium]